MAVPAASFDLVSYVGNGSAAQVISTNVDLSSGGLVILYSVTRGAVFAFSVDGSSVRCNRVDTFSVNTNTPVSDFTASSFTVKTTTYNQSGATYYAAVVKKTSSLLDVVSYTGTGSATTISHSLGQVPSACFVFRLSGASSHIYRESTQANNVYFQFSANNRFTATNRWNNSAMTSSSFPVGTDGSTNALGESYIAVLLGNLAGITNHGSYTGTASSVTVSSGFIPDFMFSRIISGTATSQNFVDTIRNPGFTGDDFSYSPFTYAQTNMGDVLQVSGSDLVSGTTSHPFNSNGNTFLRLAFKKG